jgi:hypothetical protein
VNYLQMFSLMQANVGGSQDLPWSGPTSIFNAGVPTVNGQYLEFINWIQLAYRSIQEDQDDWNWRTKIKASLALTAAQDTYSLAQIQTQLPLYEDIDPMHLWDSSSFLLVYNPTIGVADETYCYYIPYQNYRGWKDRNVIPTGKPVYYTRNPDYSLCFYPVPDKIYNVNLDYSSGIDILGPSDTATPAYLQQKWHEAIVWRAIMLWAGQRENSAKYQFATTEYTKIMAKMYSLELPETQLSLCEYWGPN